LRVEARSFYLATRSLPRSKRQAVEAIYAVLRVADDAADEGSFTDEERYERLATIAHRLERIRDPAVTGDARWFLAVREAFQRFPIRVEDALRVIDACRSDVKGVECETVTDLLSYCASVAGTVGRCSLAILGAADEDSLERAERLGIALQLTNIVRDAAKDGAKGRNYFPRELAEREDRGVAQMTALARIYYEEAGVLAKRLSNDGSRLAVLLAARLYERLLDGPLTRWQKVRCILSCIWESYVR
jgi:phytoene/squalene synthetase